MKFENVKIVKMGNKFGIWFSKFYFPKGSLVQIKVIKENKEKIFLARFNKLITLRRDMENSLNLKYQDLITVELDQIKNLARTNDLFKEDKIDMLSLTPEKTSKCYEIVVTQFDKNNETWLRIWYSHERGSGKQLEIKRFVSIEIIGSLLGQYQAEGTKHKNNIKKFKLEFTNKLLEEHRQFLNSLANLGISQETIEIIFIYNSHNISNEQANDYVEKFKSVSNHVLKTYRSQSKGVGYRIVIRNTLLTEIILHGMDKIRKLLADSEEYSIEEQKLAEYFLAKLLTGDGTLDVRCNRRDFPDLNIKIVDEDLGYLSDYYKILGNVGFHPRVNQNNIFVISSCSLKNLLYLYQIDAFRNSNNRNKLIVAIALCLKGRRYYTYSRFFELLDCERFSTSLVSKNFQLKSNMSSDWLNNKVKENLIVKNQYNSWSLTFEGKNLARTLNLWRQDYLKLKILKNNDEPFELLEALKIKKLKCSTK